MDDLRTQIHKSHLGQIGDIVLVMKRFKVFRDLGDNIDVCDEEGNCIKVPRKLTFIEDYKSELFMKAMKDAVLTVAKSLLKANNKVTTLEIKTELRRDYPYYFWTQQAVSDFMSQLAGDGVFDYTDNGTFREYRNSSTLANTPVASKTVTGSTGCGTTGNFGTSGNTAPGTMTGGLKNVGISHAFGKVAGTIPSQPAKKRGRPRKDSNTITRSKAIQLAADPNFMSVKLKNGSIRSSWVIRGQKKTPVSYVTRTKNIVEITVGSKAYKVSN